MTVEMRSTTNFETWSVWWIVLFMTGTNNLSAVIGGTVGALAMAMVLVTITVILLIVIIR